MTQHEPACTPFAAWKENEPAHQTTSLPFRAMPSSAIGSATVIPPASVAVSSWPADPGGAESVSTPRDCCGSRWSGR
jgi:hypothetical protein